MPANLENSAVATELEKASFHSNPKERQWQRMFKLPQFTFTITLNSHASKVMLKILQARLQQYVNHELPDIQAGFRKGQRNQRLNCQHPLNFGKAREFQKNIYFCFINYTKAIDCVDHSKLLNCSRDGNTRPSYLPPEKSVCRSARWSTACGCRVVPAV